MQFLCVYHVINFVTFLDKVGFSMSIIGKIIQHLYKSDIEKQNVAKYVTTLIKWSTQK